MAETQTSKISKRTPEEEAIIDNCLDLIFEMVLDSVKNSEGHDEGKQDSESLQLANDPPGNTGKNAPGEAAKLVDNPMVGYLARLAYNSAKDKHREGLELTDEDAGTAG